jgi:hypothetical protein
MATDAWELLVRFHHEVLEPELDKLRSQIGGFVTKDEMRLHFENIHKRFDRLHSLNQEIGATLQRIEKGLGSLD